MDLMLGMGYMKLENYALSIHYKLVPILAYSLASR
jgi:hypothetical protein